MMNTILKKLTIPLMYGMKPIKLYAYSTEHQWLRRTIIEFTSFFDFIVQWIHGQNETMLLQQKIFDGNFIFGFGVMVTDHATTLEAIQKPSFRTNDFMGMSVVSGNEVFIVNSPMIALGEPARTVLREHAEKTVFTKDIADLDYEAVKAKCKTVLEEWLADPAASDITKMRSVSTRMTILLLDDIDIGKPLSESVTQVYLRRFFELSLFRRYLPFVTGLLGSEKYIKKDAFYPLKAAGVSNTVIDATLFAAMFSIGTLFVRCVGDIRRHNIDYSKLSSVERRNMIIESLRLYPTVTTTHRVVENNESLVISGKTIELSAGDQVVYPFACSNSDPKAFTCPHKLDTQRAEQEYDDVLSWSKGAHACPAKPLSLLITQVMLDALDSKQALSSIDYGGSLV